MKFPYIWNSYHVPLFYCNIYFLIKKKNQISTHTWHYITEHTSPQRMNIKIFFNKHAKTMLKALPSDFIMITTGVQVKVDSNTWITESPYFTISIFFHGAICGGCMFGAIIYPAAVFAYFAKSMNMQYDRFEFRRPKPAVLDVFWGFDFGFEQLFDVVNVMRKFAEHISRCFVLSVFGVFVFRYVCAFRFVWYLWWGIFRFCAKYKLLIRKFSDGCYVVFE